MKTNTINTNHVYFDKKSDTLLMKTTENEWNPINFHWYPIIKLKNELKLTTNKMKKLSIIPFAIVAFFTSCSVDDDTLFGSGDYTTQTRDVQFFNSVSSEGVFEVTITQGASQSVEITADNNIIGEVKTRVVNNKLQLYLDDDHNYRDITLRANIVVTELNSITNSGAGDMYVYDIDSDNSFSIDNTGSADITIEGSTIHLNIQNEGSGEIFAFDFLTTNCSIDIEGSGSVEITCSDYLEVDIQGSGDVYYKGTPSVNTNISGSGSVINAN